MPLKQSDFILRKQLYQLSGGGNSNPLDLSVPIPCSSNRLSIAIKNEMVVHITISEESNLPLPHEPWEDLVIWRIGESRPRDLTLLAANKHAKGIPVFWEPINNKSHGRSVKPVCYVGHWKVKEVTFEKREIQGFPRCGRVTFELIRFDEKYARIISIATKMDPKQIESHDFSALVSSSAGNTKRLAGKKRVATSENASAPESTQSHASSPPSNPGNGSSSSRKKPVLVSHKKQSPKVVTTRTDEATSTKIGVVEPTGQPHTHPPPQPTASSSSRGNRVIVARKKKSLEDFTADEVSRVITKKGEKFHEIAKDFKEADFSGKRLVEQLSKGDDHFLKFLQQDCGLDGALCRISLMGTLKDLMEQSTTYKAT